MILACLTYIPILKEKINSSRTFFILPSLSRQYLLEIISVW